MLAYKLPSKDCMLEQFALREVKCDSLTCEDSHLTAKCWHSIYSDG